MSRYIDADKIDYTMASVYWGKDNKGKDVYRRTFVAFRSDVDELPTDDVVEVVRCKDCRYYDDGECVLHSEPKERRPYERWTVDVRENDYCSYGKKRRRKK